MKNKFTIVIGVSAGIAAYKILDLIKLLRIYGHDVYIIMTYEAAKMIHPGEFVKASRHAVYTSLFKEGFAVSLAADGELGLKLVKKEMPDIVLLDILLPKLDGFEVLEKLKADPALRAIPIVLLTNLGQKEDVDKGLKLGAADYLIKAHFMPAETVDKVKKVLASAKKQ